MKNLYVSLLAAMLGVGLLTTVFAQDPAREPERENLDEIRRNVSGFAAVLRDGLELESTATVFNRRAEPVSGRYLAGQGVVMEVNAPLRHQMHRSGLAHIRSSLQELSRQIDALGSPERTVSRPEPRSPAMPMRVTPERQADTDVMQVLREALSRIDRDDFARIDDALRQARESARHLHRAGELPDSALADFNENLVQWREQLTQQLQEYRQLLGQLGGDSTDADDLSASWSETLTRLQEALPELRDQALAQAEQLRERSEQLRVEQQQQWSEDRDALERRLFHVLCDFGAGLRSVPDDGYLSIVLNGLGDEDDAGERRDRIHVIDRDSLLQCQQGALDAVALQAAASSYDF